MATIRVTTTVEIIQASGSATTYSETTPDISTGGNPVYFAGDLERGMDLVRERMVSTVSARFGDVRQRTA